MIRALYLATAALLVVHELDSAFWREWDVLGLPGGEAGFLAIHVPLVAAVVWGYGRLVEGARAGAVLSLALALAGIGAAAIHGVLLARGGAEFRAVASIAVLAAALATSLPLAALSARALRGAGAAPRVAR